MMQTCQAPGCQPAEALSSVDAARSVSWAGTSTAVQSCSGGGRYRGRGSPVRKEGKIGEVKELKKKSSGAEWFKRGVGAFWLVVRPMGCASRCTHLCLLALTSSWVTLPVQSSWRGQVTQVSRKVPCHCLVSDRGASAGNRSGSFICSLIMPEGRCNAGGVRSETRLGVPLISYLLSATQPKVSCNRNR